MKENPYSKFNRDFLIPEIFWLWIEPHLLMSESYWLTLEPQLCPKKWVLDTVVVYNILW